MRGIRRLAFAIGCAGVGFIAACSSGSTSSSSTVSLATLQERYLAAVAPVNAAVATYDTTMAGGARASRADLITATKAVIGRLGTFETVLSAIPFPASMSGHVRAILAAAGVLSEKLASGTDAEIMKADADLSAAVAALRADLHLPSATLSG